jgi:phage major head subunit gpT-like protein
MIVNAGTLIALQGSFTALFQQTMMGVSPIWPLVAMEIQSTHAAEIHQWLGRVPQMREWVDTKQIDSLLGFQFTITNKDYESTIGVNRNHIVDDMLGIYTPRIREMGMRTATHPDKLVADARKAGTTALAYDGVAFYATTHTEGNSGVQSNLLTGTGVTTTALATDFRSARAAMLKLKDDRGEPLIESAMLMDRANPPFVITAPPDLQGAFEELLNATMLNNSSNVLAGAARLVVDARLSDTNDWYLDYSGNMVKPFINQVRQSPVFVSLTDPNASDRVFLIKEFLYGVEERRAVDYGLWQYSVKVTNT